MPLICIDGREQQFENAVSVWQAIKSLWPEMNGAALGCFDGGNVLELNDILHTDARLKLITYADEEGRRIYERSLRFVFLMAVSRCFPGEKIRIEHSVGGGIYLVMEGRRFYPGDVQTLKETMRDIVEEDLPFKKERWTRKQAIKRFKEQDDIETARLLAYRPYDYFNVYLADGLAEYFYGAMLPSTSWTNVFDLHIRTPGLILLAPDKNDPSKPAPFINMPKQMATFRQSHYWCKVLECTDAADLNDLVREGRLRDFIRVNEALQDKSIAEIADEVISRGARVVLIAGPSSSGKTTFANRLNIHLRVNGLRPVIISMDDFYRNRADLPLEADGQVDLEALTALDVPLFKECISSLLAGYETQMPRFDFTVQRRSDQSYSMKLMPDQPLIIEGIHGLNPALHEGFDSKLLFKIYISELTCLNLDSHNRIRTTDARLLRRIVRDHQFRNTSPIETLSMWDKVRSGEEKWIFPYQENADVMFNSALHYELPIFRGLAYDLLRSIPRENEQYHKCNRIIKILNYLLPAPDSIMNEIPPLSILREFIGGNTLYVNQESN